jgi:hypothetical protein
MIEYLPPLPVVPPAVDVSDDAARCECTDVASGRHALGNRGTGPELLVVVLDQTECDDLFSDLVRLHVQPYRVHQLDRFVELEHLLLVDTERRPRLGGAQEVIGEQAFEPFVALVCDGGTPLVVQRLELLRESVIAHRLNPSILTADHDNTRAWSEII